MPSKGTQKSPHFAPKGADAPLPQKEGAESGGIRVFCRYNSKGSLTELLIGYYSTAQG